MKNLKNLMMNIVNDESGQDLIEYALAACLIGLAAVATMKTLGTTLAATFTSIGTTLSSSV